MSAINHFQLEPMPFYYLNKTSCVHKIHSQVMPASLFQTVLTGMQGWLVLFLCLIALAGRAQPVLTISGAVANPLTLQAADLKAMPRTDVTARDHDGKEHRYAGVAVHELLKTAGATLGSELRGKNLKKYLLVKAADGYEVVFALPELDPEFTDQPILLADTVDGAPLVPGTGPYRVVVPGEKRPTRWVRNVKSIEIKTAP